MAAFTDVLASFLLLAGVALTLLAGVGMLRFPDVLTRMHAQTKPAVLGLLLVLAGTAVAVPHEGLRGTLVLVAAFQVLTAPVGAHMIGRAAHRAGHDDRSRAVRDDLAERELAERDPAERHPAERDPAERDRAERDPAERPADRGATRRSEHEGPGPQDRRLESP